MDPKRLQKYSNVTRTTRKDFINIHPIQAAGKLTPEAKKALEEFGDGYSICDMCLEGRLDMINKPPIHEFLEDMAIFLGMDDVRPTAGSRMAMNIIFKVIANPGDIVVIDSLAHYTTYLAAEDNKVKVTEVPHNGHPQFKLNLEAYAKKIEDVKAKTGKLPPFVVLTHVDYNYGNVNAIKIVAKICKDYNVPLVVNGAYSVGVMPIKGKEVGADFLIGSGHKSMAASGPIGVIGTTSEWVKKIFSTSTIKGDWSSRQFLQKEYHFYGCPPVYGAPIATLMASFPRVVERTKPENWDEEIKKIRYFVTEMERIEDVKALGIRPKQHTLTQFETPSLYKASLKHKQKGYYLYKALKKNKVAGIFPGSSKHFKLNTYGLTWDEIKKVAGVFQKIAEENSIKIN
ncbi:MAG: O-phospho-L-seryl-tRNA:Cys-tRNA synthase [Candidatus Helarchaeota archaeon]|nr:O-phospho-L-seryl-tRNA:Cys-tRNA synthase [Candidatus Helarchaeota archaeon]